MRKWSLTRRLAVAFAATATALVLLLSLSYVMGRFAADRHVKVAGVPVEYAWSSIALAQDRQSVIPPWYLVNHYDLPAGQTTGSTYNVEGSLFGKISSTPESRRTGRTAFLASKLGATEGPKNFTSDLLLPLFQRALASLELNPYFYPHGMGLDPAGDLARWLRHDHRMRDFKHIPLSASWESLSDAERTKFEALVDIGRVFVRYEVYALPSELWRQARANRHLNVMCCGGSCSFGIRFGSRPKSSSIKLSSYREGKSCVVQWFFPSSTWRHLSRDDRKKLVYRYLKDPGCKGNLEPLASGDSEADKELLEIYRKLFKILDPIETYERSEKERCDL